MPQWFGPKTVGYGIGPRSWQGWLATAIFVVAVIGSSFVKPESVGLPHWTRAAFIGILLLAYLGLAAATYGED
jgi:hypothetical protein